MLRPMFLTEIMEINQR